MNLDTGEMNTSWLVVSGGIEPPTFRFSGAAITVSAR